MWLLLQKVSSYCEQFIWQNRNTKPPSDSDGELAFNFTACFYNQNKSHKTLTGRSFPRRGMFTPATINFK